MGNMPEKREIAEIFTSYNPATGEIFWQGPQADSEQVSAAIAAAKEAFPAWEALGLTERISFLRAFHSALSAEKEQFATIISQENGKPLWEARNEVASMINKVDISLEAQNIRCHEMARQQGPYTLHTRYRPWGVAAVFGPFNFPGHLPNGHIIPALLAGNCIVFKPSELTPACGAAMAALWHDVGLPTGVMNLLQGGRTTGTLLAAHPGIDALFFTGSSAVGRQLAQQFGGHPEKIIALEMGGNNPLVVTAVTDLAAAAYTIIQSAFLSSGQRCSCCRRLILLEGSFADELLTALIAMAQRLSIGPYTELPEPFMGPLISSAAAEHVFSSYQRLLSSGAVDLLPMRRLHPPAPFLSPGIIDVTSISNLPDEEVFGPLLRVTRVKNFDDALIEANNTRYGLCAGLLSDDPEEFKRFHRGVRAGIVNWNAPLTGASSLAPFGGVGYSGNGRPSGYYAADYCNFPVASLEALTLSLPQTLTPGIRL